MSSIIDQLYKDYTTKRDETTKLEKDAGRLGEQLALKTLYQQLSPETIMQVDWMFKLNDKWYLVEVKHKKRFVGRPGIYEGFSGHGLNIKQVKARLQFQNDTGIRCLLFITEQVTNIVYWQWLDELEKISGFIDTPSKIRIYPLSSFNLLVEKSLESSMVF